MINKINRVCVKEYKPYKIENLVQIKSDIGEKLNSKIISSLNQL